ncbi:MAG: HYR domain-containing protein, partial [Verrucomicrobia bacterium]|nr:HYR domain-containing protein [Verrucomicrobiota bacterium]
MTELDLRGEHPVLGLVKLRLRDPAQDPHQASGGEIEELVNNTTGILDVPPFAATGLADSFFDVFVEIEVTPPTGASFVWHNHEPKRVRTVIDHKPPGPGRTYEDPQRIPLFDAQDQFTGYYLCKTRHTPVPPEPEVDYFPQSRAEVTLCVGNQEVPVRLSGPTTVEVYIGPNGEAADADGNGRDEVVALMRQMDLAGTDPAGNTVKLRLRPVGMEPFGVSRGLIEERVNNTPGRLDVPPFTATGLADSFFDVFFELEVTGPTGAPLLKLHNHQPKRMRTVIDHKPPGEGPVYEDPARIPLFDEQDRPTNYSLCATRHIPVPPECAVSISCPPDVVVKTPDPVGAVVNYPAPVAVGNCPPIAVKCEPPSGSLFPLGTTVVTCTATDAEGNTARCTFTVTVRFVEIDVFPASVARLTVCMPNNEEIELTLSGPTTVEVDIGPNGEAADTDGDGREQVATRVTQMALTGTHPVLGQIGLRLRDPAKHPQRVSGGEIEELANATAGILDVPPFVGAGLADSFFDVFVEIEVKLPGGPTVVWHNHDPKRVRTVIDHKPPGAGRTYEDPQRIPLYDENEEPTGYYLCKTRHTPVPPEPEVDYFPQSRAEVTLCVGNQEVPVRLSGPTTVEVYIGPNGEAADADGNGRDEVVALMRQMDLAGTDPAGNTVKLRLRPVGMEPFGVSRGLIEERVNNTPGRLDVPPFTATGLADSFFDVFFELEVTGPTGAPLLKL